MVVCGGTSSHRYLSQGGYVFTGVSLFVSRINQKRIDQFSQKFGAKLSQGPLKKPLDFGGNPNHVYIMLGLRLGYC